MTSRKSLAEKAVKYEEFKELMRYSPLTLENYENALEMLEQIEYKFFKDPPLSINFMQKTEMDVYLRELEHQFKTAFMFRNNESLVQAQVILDNLVASLSSTKLSESPKTKTIIVQLKRLIPVVLSPYCNVESIDTQATFNLVKDHILDLYLQKLIRSPYIHPDMDYNTYRLETLEPEEKTDLMNIYLQLVS